MNIKGFFIYIICLKIEYPCLYKKNLSKKSMIMKCIKYKSEQHYSTTEYYTTEMSPWNLISN